MRIVFLDEYTKNGRDIFLYEVEGSAEELAAYEEAKGEYFRRSEKGKPLFFSTNYVGDVTNIRITPNGNVVADRSAMKKAMSLVKQAGGDAGQAMAAQAAAAIFGSMFGKSAPVRASSATLSTEKVLAEPEQEKLDDLD